MRQLQFFSTVELAKMRDRTKRRNYSPAGDEFRREHERHRALGLQQRHAAKLSRLRRAAVASELGSMSEPSPGLANTPAKRPPASAPRSTGQAVVSSGCDGRVVVAAGPDGQAIVAAGADGQAVVSSGSDGRGVVAAVCDKRTVVSQGPVGASLLLRCVMGGRLLLRGAMGGAVVAAGCDGRAVVVSVSARQVFVPSRSGGCFISVGPGRGVVSLRSAEGVDAASSGTGMPLPSGDAGREPGAWDRWSHNRLNRCAG